MMYWVLPKFEEDSVGCVLLGDTSSLKEGDDAKTTGKLLSVPVGMGLLGRVVDAVGRPIDGKGPMNLTKNIPLKELLPVSFPENQWTNPSKLESWLLIP